MAESDRLTPVEWTVCVIAAIRRLAFRTGVAVSLVTLMAILVFWPRSFFYADKWWVRNTRLHLLPPEKPRMTTGIDPARWQSGAAYMSHRGCVMHQWHIRQLFPGSWQTERLGSDGRVIWLPRSSRFSIEIPYWILAIAVAIMPAIWMLGLRRSPNWMSRFSFSTRHLLILMTMLAICLTGYVQASTAGAVTVSAMVIAATMGVFLLRGAASCGRASAVARRITSTGMLLCAAYLAFLYADRCLHFQF
jgi:hypothetical protein